MLAIDAVVGSQFAAWGRRAARVFDVDYPLLFLALALGAIGCLALYSAGGRDAELVARHAARLAVGFVALFVLARLAPGVFMRFAFAFYGVCLAALALVLVWGDSSKGAQRWLDFGFVRFQPSELMKVAVPLALCALCCTSAPPARKLLLALPMLAVPAALVVLQPDLGTAILIVAAGFACLFLAGTHWSLFAGTGALLAVASPLIWRLMPDYQRSRVLALLDPEADPLGVGYHAIQAKIAIGSGGAWGKGWMNGTQSQLEFIPERATDFIFAAFAEEFGFVGGCMLILLYLLALLRGLRIAFRATHPFCRLLAGALTLSLGLHVFVNIAMVAGLLPIVGVPLPLVSYGGTSALVILASFGILMSIARHRTLMGATV